MTSFKTTVYLEAIVHKHKKYKAVIMKTDGTKCTVRFGAAGMLDYTIHKDKTRKKRYEVRHTRKENWTKNGICTAGFWSKWLLWNKPSLKDSIQNMEHRFGIRIVLKRPTNKK